MAGFTFGLIGVFYGLLLAFVIVAAWERFDCADEKVQREAISLASLYRLVIRLSSTAADSLRQDVRRYTEQPINVECPKMATNFQNKTF